MEKLECPFEEGDRVDHKLFGFATVNGPPVAQVGPDATKPGGVREAGWSVPVAWDDSDRAPGRVASWALTKVASPDTRPFTYWDRQWQPLLTAWLSSRRAFEDAAKSFRPAPTPDQLTDLKRREDTAYAAMQCFWTDEQARRH